MLGNKFKSQMINVYVHICNSTQTNVVKGGVDQSFEINEHVTFKRGLSIIEHVVHIPITNLMIHYNRIEILPKEICDAYLKPWKVLTPLAPK